MILRTQETGSTLGLRNGPKCKGYSATKAGNGGSEERFWAHNPHVSLHARPQLDSIWILGGLGGRFDHSVATLSALYQWRDNPCKARLVLITEVSQIILLNEVGRRVAPGHSVCAFN